MRPTGKLHRGKPGTAPGEHFVHVEALAALEPEVVRQPLGVRPRGRGSQDFLGQADFLAVGLSPTLLADRPPSGDLAEVSREFSLQFDEPIGINVNGCPNACARFQVADIGLKGSLIGGEEGFQIHLGGSLGVDAALGRKVRGLKVTARELPDFVERILLTFQSERTEGESFASWVRRADESVLA